jgi:hypothetical protein
MVTSPLAGEVGAQRRIERVTSPLAGEVGAQRRMGPTPLALTVG